MQPGYYKPCTYPSFGKYISVCFMALLLIFLTCINYFLYSSSPIETGVVKTQPGSDAPSAADFPFPAGPDEKSPDAPVNINEEYVHENHQPAHNNPGESMILHKIHEAEKLCIVHTEQFSPPPEA